MELKSADAEKGDMAGESGSPPSYDLSQKDAPPSYESLSEQIRKAREESTGNKDFVQSTMKIICGSATVLLIVIILTGMMLGVPIAMIVVGSLHLDDCPAEELIPIYLIVAGVTSLVNGSFSHGGFQSRLKKVKSKQANPRCEDEDDGGKKKKIISCFSTLLNSFSFAWAIAGSVWIYRIYEPNYTDPTVAGYCDKTTYLFAFWVTTLGYIFMGLAICVCCVSCIACCFCCGKKSDQASDAERGGK